MAAARITTDHASIRRWIEERGGCPARVKATGNQGDPGVLRVDFPGYGDDESLEHLSWEAWFEAFDANQLAFLHQDQTEHGDVSRFNKLVARDSAKRAGGGEAHP